MTFSKSFGYAIRGILYVAKYEKIGKKIQLDEIADTLNIHRYFLAKIMNKVVKEGILNSNKGHSGGFSVNNKTLETSLMVISDLVGELNEEDICILRFRSCNNNNPCPLHHRVTPLRFQWKKFMTRTRIKHLLQPQSSKFLDSLSSD